MSLQLRPGRVRGQVAGSQVSIQVNPGANRPVWPVIFADVKADSSGGGGGAGLASGGHIWGSRDGCQSHRPSQQAVLGGRRHPQLSRHLCLPSVRKWGECLVPSDHLTLGSLGRRWDQVSLAATGSNDQNLTTGHSSHYLHQQMQVV